MTIAILAILAFAMTGCGNGDPLVDTWESEDEWGAVANGDPLVGTWEGEDEWGAVAVEFRSNGTGEIRYYYEDGEVEDSYSFEWSVDGDILTMIEEGGEEIETTFEIDGNELTVPGHGTLTRR